jgi:hypothetical protein
LELTAPIIILVPEAPIRLTIRLRQTSSYGATSGDGLTYYI